MRAAAEQNRTRGIIETSKTISVRACPCRVRCRDEETHLNVTLFTFEKKVEI